METQDIARLCRERFVKWRALLTKHMCLPVCVIGLPLHNPLDTMKVFVLGHTDRIALQIFLQQAAESVVRDDDLTIVDD